MKYGDGFWKVELHVHLDGSYRPKTVMDIAKRRSMTLPASNSVEEFAEHIRVKEPGTLATFLTNFPIFLDVVNGDREAIKRTAFEFVEDCAQQKMAYVETRFAPQLLAGNDVSVEEVISLTLEGVREASEKFGTKCNLILTTIREFPQWAEETLEMAKKFHKKGVVGMDVAGSPPTLSETADDIHLHDITVKVFQEAEKLGISRTAHAGENGPAKAIREAIDKMAAQRIGHGYKVLQDMDLYKELKEKNIHFETCPLSSRLTGSVSTDWSKHPIITFAKDRVNYSINTDDTIITGRNLTQEYELCQKELQLDAAELVRCNFNAARSAFLEDNEKEELLNHLRRVLNAS